LEQKILDKSLLYQVLDNKRECYAVFCNNALYHYPNSLELTHTWEYSPHFEDQSIEYAKIWAHGRSLSDMCPDHLKDEWSLVSQKAAAYITSFKEAKISLDDVCFYDSVPKKFLLRYCKLKNDICEWVFEHNKKPANYDFLLKLTKFTQKIREQKLNLISGNLNFIDHKVRKNFNKVKNSSQNIKYNIWGTATGRLSSEKDSFPILTLNKELKSIVVPNNDLFVELDYNSAELRVLLALSGRPQPAEDIHSWISDNIFNNKFERSEAKKRVFSWLYNPKAKNKKLNDYLQRDKILNKYYSDGIVHTPLGRKLHSPPEKALNYLIQSTASDLFLTNVLKIDTMLKDKKSFISFCVHDSLVIDFAQQDRPLVEKIIEVFSNTSLGDFKTNLSAGPNYGSLRAIS
jgi:hypothetical protein